MKRIIFFCLFLFSILVVNGQDKFYNSGTGYALFGDGDYAGINYYSNVQFPVLKFVDIKVGLQIANASETREEYFYDRHNVFNLANIYNLAITPIQTNHFKLLVSAGVVWRYRSEIVFNSSKTVFTDRGSSLLIINNDYNTSFDAGYNVDLSALIRITERVYVGGCGQFIGYNKGSGLFSISFGFSYKL